MRPPIGDRIRNIWGKPSARIVAIYLIIGGLWILLSDRLLAAVVDDPQVFVVLSIAKGWMYVLFTGWLLYTLINRDISAIRRSERALEASERRLRLAVDNFPYLFLIYGPDLRIRHANAEALQRIGLRPDQVIGHTDEEIFGPKQVEKYLPTLRRAVEAKAPLSVETTLDVPPGSIIVVFHFIPVLDEEGDIYQILGLAYDVTAERMAEARKRELEEQQQEFYRRTILAATEGKLVVTDRGDVEGTAGPPITTWDIRTGEDLARIRYETERIATEYGMDRERIFDFVLAVGEATTNAYKHAGGGTASLHRVDDDLMMVVSDQGKGMEALALPEVALKRGYSTAKSLGMGYKAIISVADKVYLATGPGGTTVGIRMGLHAPESAFATLGLPDTWAQPTDKGRG